jgi:PAS domain S-box-containing protein
MSYSVAGSATTGAEAVSLAEELRPDMVLMDIVLQGEMDGIDAAKAITSLLDIPVIFLTAFADEKTVERAKLAGSYGYLIKPFQDRDLKVTIEMALQKSAQERELRRSEKHFRTLAAISPAGIYMADAKGCYRYVNERWCEMTGLSAQEALDDGWLKAVHPDDRRRVRAEWKKFIGNGHGWDQEYRFVSPDGRETWVVGDVAQLRDNSGKPAGYIGTNLNITEHKRAEQERRALVVERCQGELYKFVVGALPALGSMVPQELRTLMMNRFGDQLERYKRAGFTKELARCAEGDADPRVVFDCYAAWFCGWMADMGISASAVRAGEAPVMEIRDCPWHEAAKENPIFCLICRVMVTRSFSWTGLAGEVTQRTSRAAGADICRFDFRIHPCSLAKA